MPIFLATAGGPLMLLGLFLSPAKAPADVPRGVDAAASPSIEGDTLWGLAASSRPSWTRARPSRQIAEINNLEAQRLFPGTELFVPSAR